MSLYLELHDMLRVRAVDEFDAGICSATACACCTGGRCNRCPAAPVFAIRPQAVDEQQASALWSSLQVLHRPAAFYRVIHELP